MLENFLPKSKIRWLIALVLLEIVIVVELDFLFLSYNNPIVINAYRDASIEYVTDYSYICNRVYEKILEFNSTIVKDELRRVDIYSLVQVVCQKSSESEKLVENLIIYDLNGTVFAMRDLNMKLSQMGSAQLQYTKSNQRSWLQESIDTEVIEMYDISIVLLSNDVFTSQNQLNYFAQQLKLVHCMQKLNGIALLFKPYSVNEHLFAMDELDRERSGLNTLLKGWSLVQENQAKFSLYSKTQNFKIFILKKD